MDKDEAAALAGQYIREQLESMANDYADVAEFLVEEGAEPGGLDLVANFIRSITEQLVEQLG